MRRIGLGLVAALLVAVTGVAFAGTAGVDYVDGVLLVNFSTDIGTADLAQGVLSMGDAETDLLLEQFGATAVKDFWDMYRPQNPDYAWETRNYRKVFFPSGTDMYEVAAEFSMLPNVTWAEPDYLYKIDYTPNDPSFGAQWWATLIEADRAWDHTNGDESVVVASMDTGVHWTHPDLWANIWVNPGEDIDGDPRPSNPDFLFEEAGTDGDWNSLDDDENGLIDDFIGWDFVSGVSVAPGEDGQTPDNNPDDFNGHGTGCAAAMAEVTDNETGGAGTAWGCKIMCLRIGYEAPDHNGYMQNSASIQAMAYATDMGADIVNMSFGSSQPAQGMQSAINIAWANNMMLFGAAGNDGVGTRHYPGGLDNVICVGASTSSDQRASFSNWGTWVTVAAPGQGCFTAYGDGYTTWDGTSVASPIAAGVGALVIASFPEQDNSDWRNIVIDSVDPITTDHPIGAGRVNAYQAITQSRWPELAIETWSITDPDGNGHPDPGETIEVRCTVSNAEGWQPAILTTATISFDIQGMEMTSPEVFLGTIEGGGMVDNNSTPMTFRVPDSGIDGVFADLTLTISTQAGDPYEIADSRKLLIGTAPILLVDDDGGEFYDQYITANLDEIGLVYNHHDVNALSFEITAEYLSDYAAIIWMTGDEESPLSNDEIAALEGAMDSGSNVLIFGQTLDEQLTGTSFYSDYLHAESATGATQVALDPNPAAENPPVVAGRIIITGPGGAGNSHDPDIIAPVNGGVAAYNYITANTPTGAVYFASPDGYKVFYASFAFEAISGASNSLSRRELLGSILAWFDVNDVSDDPAASLAMPAEFAIASAYPNPFNPSTTLSIQVPRASEVQLLVYDLLGREVGQVFSGMLKPGSHRFTWQPEHLSAGVYFAVMRAQGVEKVTKLAFVK